MGHLESLTISGLRLEGDLERLWWKLFIHVNSDLSEISQEQLWLLDTSASRGRQSVAKMMTPLWVICIQLSQSSSGGDQRLGNSSVSSQRSHGTTSTKADSVRSRTHRSTPTRSHPGDLVGKYGVQASATDLEALPFGPNPPLGDPALGHAIQYGSPRSGSKRPVERPSSSDRSDRSATKRSVQQSLVNRPVHSEHSMVTPGPGNTVPGTGTR